MGIISVQFTKGMKEGDISRIFRVYSDDHHRSTSIDGGQDVQCSNIYTQTIRKEGRQAGMLWESEFLANTLCSLRYVILATFDCNR